MNTNLFNKPVESNNQTSKVEYGKLFAGEAEVTPVRFNPTLEETIKLKNVNQKYADILRGRGEIDYKKVDKANNEWRIISLLCKFNPNEMIKDNTVKYEDNVFVDYQVTISNRLVQSTKNPNKYMVIDNKLNTVWIDLPNTKLDTVKKAIIQYNKEKVNEDKPHLQLCDQSARVAYQGEYQLLSLINNLAGKSKFNYNKAAYDKMIEDYKIAEATDKNKAAMIKLKDYKIALNTADKDGNFKLIDIESHQKNFEKLVKGDVSQLNKIFDMKNEEMSLFRVKNENDEITMRKIGVLLYVTKANNDKFYQQVLSDNNSNSIATDATFAVNTKAWKNRYELIDENDVKSYASSTEDTKLTSYMLNNALKSNAKYPFKGFIRKGTLAFGEFNPSTDYTAIEGMSNTAINGLDSMADITLLNTLNSASKNDDLPF